MKTILHINHNEGPGKLEGAFKLAHTLGYDGIELRRKYNFPDLTTEQYRSLVAAEKQKHPDFEILFGGRVECHSEDESEVEREVSEYLKFLEWAAKNCGTRQLNMMTGTMVRPGAEYREFERNGSNMATDFHYARSSKWLRVIGNTAAELKMRIALETHNCYLHDLAQPCKKLMELTKHPAIGINFDYGNIFINKNGESLEEAMRILEPYIYYVHLKNIMMPFGNKTLFMSTHLDQGHINNATILEYLRDSKYDGMIGVEYTSSGDGYYAAKRALEYLKSLYSYLKID